DWRVSQGPARRRSQSCRRACTRRIFQGLLCQASLLSDYSRMGHDAGQRSTGIYRSTVTLCVGNRADPGDPRTVRDGPRTPRNSARMAWTGVRGGSSCGRHDSRQRTSLASRSHLYCRIIDASWRYQSGSAWLWTVTGSWLAWRVLPRGSAGGAFSSSPSSLSFHFLEQRRTTQGARERRPPGLLLSISRQIVSTIAKIRMSMKQTDRSSFNRERL